MEKRTLESSQDVGKRILENVRRMVYDARTEILKVFLPFQEGQNLRLWTTDAGMSNTESGLAERIAVVERRLQEIEKKLLLRPPAA